MSCVGCIRTRSPRVASGNSSVKEVSVAVQATDGAGEKKLHPASMLLFSFFLARRVAARKIKGATLRSTAGLSLAKRHFRPAFGLAIARTIYLLSFLYFPQLILPTSLLSYQPGPELLIRPAPWIESAAINYSP